MIKTDDFYWFSNSLSLWVTNFNINIDCSLSSFCQLLMHQLVRSKASKKHSISLIGRVKFWKVNESIVSKDWQWVQAGHGLNFYVYYYNSWAINNNFHPLDLRSSSVPSDHFQFFSKTKLLPLFGGTILLLALFNPFQQLAEYKFFPLESFINFWSLILDETPTKFWWWDADCTRCFPLKFLGEFQTLYRHWRRRIASKARRNYLYWRKCLVRAVAMQFCLHRSSTKLILKTSDFMDSKTLKRW